MHLRRVEGIMGTFIQYAFRLSVNDPIKNAGIILIFF